jgi:hypothetical protein
MLAAYDDKTAAEQGELAQCYAKGPDKLKGFPLAKVNDGFHAVYAGNVVVTSGVGALVRGKVTEADIDAFLGSLDLAAIAKL